MVRPCAACVLPWKNVYARAAPFEFLAVGAYLGQAWGVFTLVGMRRRHAARRCGHEGPRPRGSHHEAMTALGSFVRDTYTANSLGDCRHYSHGMLLSKFNIDHIHAQK